MKKKIICLFTVFSMLIGCMPLIATAATVVDNGSCGTNVTWKLDDEGTLTISGTGDMRDYSSSYSAPWYSNRSSIVNVVIESGVTSIGYYAFYGCSDLTSVTISDSIVRIREQAFRGCSSLTSVYYNAEDCTSLDSVFSDCTSLKTVYIGDNVKSIPSHAFSSCSSLTSVTIGSGVTSIGSNAFYNCSSIENITIPNSVTSIDSYAFDYCSNLTDVYISDLAAWCNIAFYNAYSNPLYYANNLHLNNTLITELVIPDGVTSIGRLAFSSYSNLTSVTIPDSVTSIGSYAFSSCSALTSVTIGNSVRSIGEDAFYNCRGLTSVTIPDSVTSIGSWAFYNCTGLTSVTIPDSVTSISRYAFYYCSGLTSVTIGNGVTSIGDYAFYKCSGLKTIYYNAENCTSMGSSDYPVFEGCTAINKIYIGDNVKSIPSYAFSGCSGLETIYYNAENCTSMGSSNYPVFEGCTALKEIYIGDNVKKIPNYAFYGTGYYNDSSNWDNGVLYINNCLIKANSGEISAEYEINNATRVIADSALSGCSGLTSITIPDSVTNVGSDAFYGCSGLDSVYISDMTAYLNIDFGNATSCPMYYANKLYLNDRRVTSVEISNDVIQIPTYAFSGCDSIISVIVSDSVTNIGEYAFSGCAGLTDVYYNGTLSEFVKISVGSNNGAFSNTKIHCTDITAERWGTCGDNLAWTLNEGTLTISGMGDMTNYSSSSAPWYDSRSSITSVIIGNGVTSIGNYAFNGCTKLTNATIGSGVTSIGNNAFSGCDNLTSLNYNAQKVYDAFSSCGNLTTLVLGSGVTNIDKNAFAKCKNLETIIIPKTVTEIEIGAFSGCSSLATVEYGGSEEDWNGMYIGSDNDYLTNATIHYNSALAPTPAPEPCFTVTDGTITNTADTEQTAAVIIAAYDADGALASVTAETVTFGADEEKTFTVPRYGKIFVWNSLGGMVPLTK